MSISLLTSVPGGGKTSYAVWHEIRKASEAGRVVYTCGIPKLLIPTIRVSLAQLHKWHERVLVGEAHDPEDTPIHELTNFKEGSLIVVDEVYKLWPVMGKGNTPEDVEYLREHRHHGLDWFLMTQRPGFVNTEVLGLVERHMHIYPDWFGRKIYEWTEYRNNPTTTSVKREAVSKPYKIPKQSFDLYHSSSVHIKPKKAIPIRLFFSVGVLLAAPFALWGFGSSVAAKFHPSAAVVAPEAVKVAAAPVAIVPVVAPVPDPAPAPENKPAMIPVQLLTAAIDWKIVSACLQSEKNGCICYGKSAERLVIPKESCELAVKHGWAGI